MAPKKKSLARKVLTLSSTPWVLFLSAVCIVVASIVLPFVASSRVEGDAFESVVLIALAEGLVALYLIVSSLESATSLGIEKLHVVPPPGSINQDLLDLVVQLKHGSLTIICYGSNRFGKVLDTVSDHLPQLNTRVMVCTPERALDKNDAVAIEDFIVDMEDIPHVTISQTTLMPTIRAAVVHDDRGTAIWASASFYLVYNHRRALRSEGTSPVLKVDDPRSPMMPMLADFILKEFARLAAAGEQKSGASNATHPTV
jgi:hypothetical protein